MRLVLVFLVGISLVACGPGMAFGPTITPEPTPTPDPCAPDAARAKIEEMDDLAVEFLDASDLAGATPRASLAPMIADMQEIRRDAERLDMPGCLALVQDKLILAMNDSIEAFQLFLANEPDAVVSAQFSKAAASIEAYSTERERATNSYAIPEPEATTED